MNNKDFIERHPVIVFYVLAFSISWLGWLPQALHERVLFPFTSPLLNFLGGGGPTLAAVIVLWASKKKAEIPALFKSLLKIGVSFWWFVFVFGFWVVVSAITFGIGMLLGLQSSAVNQFAWSSILPIFIMMLLSNVWEEIGWRGFVLPRLQEKLSDLKIIFIMGFLWSLWHVPLMLNPDNPMSYLPWYLEVLFSLSLTVIYTWLYLNTNRSLFFVSVFHAMSNTVAFVLLDLNIFVSSYVLVVSITSIVAIGIILIYGSQRFFKSSPKATGG
jgi:membrane protease YdiL (CAAX protease family)